MFKRNLIYFVGRFGAALIALLSISVYTRLLSPDAYGTYALVISGVVMAYSGATQWINFSITRFVPAYQEREHILLSHIAASLIVMSAAGVLIGIYAWFFIVDTDYQRALLGLAIALFLGHGIAEITLSILNATLKASAFATYSIARSFVSAIIGISLAFAGYNAIGILVGVLAGHLCIVMPNLLSQWRGISRIHLDRKVFWVLLAYGMPAAVTGILGTVIQVGDRFIIEHFLGMDMAGLYSAPYDLSTRTLQVLMLVLSMASGPVIYRAFESNGWEAAGPIMLRYSQTLLTISLPVAVAFFCFTPVIATVMLGSKFHAAAIELIPWIIAGTLLRGFHGYYFTYSFMLTKKPARQTLILGGCAVINIVLNLILVPWIGLVGAAAATLVASAFILVASIFVGRKLLALPFPIRDTIKVCGACAIMALVFLPVVNETSLWRTMPSGIAGGIVYLVAIYVLDAGETRAFFSKAVTKVRLILPLTNKGN